MKKAHSEILRVIFTPILDVSILFCVFIAAYNIRSITDGIPFIQLRIPYISFEQFIPFIISGIIIWLIVFTRAGLYSHHRIPLFEEIQRVIIYALFWFLTYIGFVYLTQGFLFSKEIPRLIIIYTLIFGTIGIVIGRILLEYIWKFATLKNIIPKRDVLIIEGNNNWEVAFELSHDTNFIRVKSEDIEAVESIIRAKEIDAILLVDWEYSDKKFEKILSLAKIYGIECSYPRILPHMKHFKREEDFVGGVPVITLKAVAITPWQQVIKRIFDIIFSLLFIILASPILIIIALIIKLEDPDGPIIYKNRRIWENGTIFTLYKFRYMYWKYCTKEEYIRPWESDSALEFEEALKQKQNGRSGPLYKIQNDPRIMKTGKFIEKLSLDELPQLFNVLIGNMSLVGPRPHQPREVEQYEETDKQVLTIKPGITGMAQVYGRDKNTFKEEVLLDTFYIENYSFFLDIMIILRTILVVLGRPFEKR